MKNPLRSLLMAVLLSTAVPAADFPFGEATIEQLQTRMVAGQLTAHQLTAAYLERIAQIDRAGP